MAGKSKSKSKKKKRTVIIRLVSSASGYFKTTRKNPRMEGGKNGKIEKMMFDPTPSVRKHVLFTEKKIK